MLRSFTVILAAAMLFGASVAEAAPCKDASGKFTACPAPAAAKAASFTTDAKGNCHDASGKMVKKTMCAAAPAAASASGGPSGAALASGPQCKKGKRCGNACIAATETCHK